MRLKSLPYFLVSALLCALGGVVTTTVLTLVVPMSVKGFVLTAAVIGSLSRIALAVQRKK
jgi:hypothetical protein